MTPRLDRCSWVHALTIPHPCSSHCPSCLHHPDYTAAQAQRPFPFLLLLLLWWTQTLPGNQQPRADDLWSESPAGRDSALDHSVRRLITRQWPCTWGAPGMGKEKGEAASAQGWGLFMLPRNSLGAYETQPRAGCWDSPGEHTPRPAPQDMTHTPASTPRNAPHSGQHT